MILSVSRRTDIPAFYGDWFMNRVREGFLSVKNPYNPSQIRKIDLTPDNIDCIVFWTKNPSDFLGRLEELKEYSYYFQFTITGYGKDIEPGIPDKKKTVIPAFRALAEKLGKERVIWRYDPIFLSRDYSSSYHEKAFGEIAGLLKDSTSRVVISFLDFYRSTRKNMKNIGLKEEREELLDLAKKLGAIARANGIRCETCAEQEDLRDWDIVHTSCIDKNLVERLAGHPVNIVRDRNQRKECLCAQSVDVGAYDTCPAGCLYCYASRGRKTLEKSLEHYDKKSTVLCG